LIKLLSGIHRHGSYDGEFLVDGKRAEFAELPMQSMPGSR
jgi:hypothetical protein